MKIKLLLMLFLCPVVAFSQPEVKYVLTSTDFSAEEFGASSRNPTAYIHLERDTYTEAYHQDINAWMGHSWSNNIPHTTQYQRFVITRDSRSKRRSGVYALRLKFYYASQQGVVLKALAENGTVLAKTTHTPSSINRYWSIPVHFAAGQRRAEIQIDHSYNRSVREQTYVYLDYLQIDQLQ